MSLWSFLIVGVYSGLDESLLLERHHLKTLTETRAFCWYWAGTGSTAGSYPLGSASKTNFGKDFGPLGGSCLVGMVDDKMAAWKNKIRSNSGNLKENCLPLWIIKTFRPEIWEKCSGMVLKQRVVSLLPRPSREKHRRSFVRRRGWHGRGFVDWWRHWWGGVALLNSDSFLGTLSWGHRLSEILGIFLGTIVFGFYISFIQFFIKKKSILLFTFFMFIKFSTTVAPGDVVVLLMASFVLSSSVSTQDVFMPTALHFYKMTQFKT